MNNTSKLVPFLLVTLSCLSTAAPAGDGTVYGAGLSDKVETVAIAELLAEPEAYVGKKIRVAGRITDVCPKRGCWIDIEGDKKNARLRFKVQDGEIVFPVDAKGKPVTAEGVLTRIELDRDEAEGWLRHQAEEKGETFDPSGVTGPLTLYQIAGVGAVVR